ncbi:6-O-methylguanine DNA methyltransferase [Syncephalis fuscata]|nr:6-O-methylguanine DNA methyltransferase [Syncephalis fuscata]
MPRVAKRKINQKTSTQSPYFSAKLQKNDTGDKAPSNEAVSTIYYPLSVKERENFINSTTGRRVTEFQFRVYDLCAQIPEGYYSTYKQISDSIKGSPRAVGQALRCNPFAPLPVPCHRVLTSNAFIGGFRGTWGKGSDICDKQMLLKGEGIIMDENDYVAEDMRQSRLFTSFKV